MSDEAERRRIAQEIRDQIPPPIGAGMSEYWRGWVDAAWAVEVNFDQDRRPGGHRVLTREEMDELLALAADPEYLRQLGPDPRSLVEVDNPFRREVRPRRGTAEQTPAKGD